MASPTRLSLRHPTSRLFLFLVSTFTTLLSPHYASADTFQPITTSGASSVFLEGQRMFVSGGTPDGVGGFSSTNQTFSLDLSSRWDVATPRFAPLPAGPVSDHNIPNTLLTDTTSWLFFSHGQAFIFDTTQQAWRFSASVSNLAPLESRTLEAVVDPGSGTVMIPGGFTNLGDRYSLMQYTTTEATTPRSAPMPDGLAGVDGYAAVWSTQMKRMLVHGGGGDGKLSGDLYSYDPSLVVDGSSSLPATTTSTGASSSSTSLPLGWALLAVNQQDGLGEKEMPSPRRGHCFVPAYGGTKMVLFGGFTTTTATTGSGGQQQQQRQLVASSDIFVFDVATLSWKKLSSSSSSNDSLGRAYAACAVSGDMFVVWGGKARSGEATYMTTTTTVTQNVTFVFNLRLGQFMDQFDPEYTDGSSGAGGVVSENASKTGTPSTAAIFGGIIGGLAVIFLLAAVLFTYLKRRREQEESNMTERKLTQQEQALYTNSPPRTPTTPTEKVLRNGYEIGAMEENMRRGPHLSISTLRGPHSPVSPVIVSDCLRGPRSAGWGDSQSESGSSSSPGSPYIIMEHNYPSSSLPHLPHEYGSGPSTYH
ncbi:hypothetical protein BGZ59_010493 [Podila verticillata]|nr:hypothetical protein BGZ59_010493 [Podila verticillata]KFH67574.1 hypothetical protein MVEG_06306 [Podila verticillata NRRL 6337]